MRTFRALAAFSADGRWLLTGGYGNAAVLWATDTWQPVFSLYVTMTSPAFGKAFAILADGSRLVGSQVAHGLNADIGWMFWDLSQIRSKLTELGLGWEAAEADRMRASHPVGRGAVVTERTMSPALYPPAASMLFVRRCLELEPDQAQACTDLAWHLATIADPALRNPEQALPLAWNAVRLSPESPTCWNTLGAVLYHLGQYREAIGALQKSIHLNADVPTSHDALFLAMSHHRLGQPVQARTWYDRALSSAAEPWQH